MYHVAVFWRAMIDKKKISYFEEGSWPFLRAVLREMTFVPRKWSSVIVALWTESLFNTPSDRNNQTPLIKTLGNIPHTHHTQYCPFQSWKYVCELHYKVCMLPRLCFWRECNTGNSTIWYLCKSMWPRARVRPPLRTSGKWFSCIA